MYNKIFICLFCLINFNSVFAADYAYVEEKIELLKNSEEDTKVQVVQELGRLSSNANLKG